MPVAPPRRKRKSKHVVKSLSSKDSQTSIDSPPISLEITPIHVPAGKNDVIRSHDQTTGCISIPHGQATCVSNGSHNQSGDSLFKPSECFSEDDVSSSANTDNFHAMYAVSDHTSLAVLNPGSTSRSHSLVSPTDVHNFMFSSHVEGSCSTMPRGGAISWSPNSMFSEARVDSRKSKRLLMPASSELIITWCLPCHILLVGCTQTNVLLSNICLGLTTFILTSCYYLYLYLMLLPLSSPHVPTFILTYHYPYSALWIQHRWS